MSESKVKSYQSKFPNHSMNLRVDGRAEPVKIQFAEKPKGHGEVEIKDPAVQAAIEASEPFRVGTIRVKWSDAEKARAKAAEARAAANAAEKVAKEAEAEAAKFDAPKAKAPAAPVAPKT